MSYFQPTNPISTHSENKIRDKKEERRNWGDGEREEYSTAGDNVVFATQ